MARLVLVCLIVSVGACGADRRVSAEGPPNPVREYLCRNSGFESKHLDRIRQPDGPEVIRSLVSPNTPARCWGSAALALSHVGEPTDVQLLISFLRAALSSETLDPRDVGRQLRYSLDAIGVLVRRFPESPAAQLGSDFLVEASRPESWEGRFAATMPPEVQQRSATKLSLFSMPALRVAATDQTKARLRDLTSSPDSFIAAMAQYELQRASAEARTVPTALAPDDERAPR